MGGKLGLSNGLDAGFGVTKLAAGVAVGSGVCIIMVACVEATPFLAPVLATSKMGTSGEAVPTVTLLPSSVPLHAIREGVCQFSE